jgi:transposase InsO family protein
MRRIRWIQGENVYYDRAFINNVYGTGFHLINDLVPLYHMVSYFNKYNDLSKEAKQRIKWFDYFKECSNVVQTCRHFDISRKTFYKWQKVYDPNNLYSLEDRPTIPIRKRQRDITSQQELRIIRLRKKHIRYSKVKLAKIYKEEYNEVISSWKVQKVIEKHNLYYNPVKTARTTKKRLKAQKKKRITELRRKPKSGFLICLDTVQIRLYQTKRYIFTAIDNYSKVAFARMYKGASSYNAADFLNRLLYLTEGRIENIQTDNGSEFAKYFDKGCVTSQLERYYSRVRTPKDNAVNERFNRTLQDEFIALGNFDPDTVAFNRHLTEWLIEYNFKRPHQSLGYETPIKFNKVLPRYPSRTFI